MVDNLRHRCGRSCGAAPQAHHALQQLWLQRMSGLQRDAAARHHPQYGRRFDADDGENPLPPDPDATDLPAIHPYWGPRPPRPA